jgi:hypothetical protein
MMATRKRSPKMTAKRRRSLPKSKFGLPGSRKYPMDTPGRAANAKARATQQYKKGRISASTKNRIHAKANRILGKGRKRSGRRRKK